MRISLQTFGQRETLIKPLTKVNELPQSMLSRYAQICIIIYRRRATYHCPLLYFMYYKHRVYYTQ